MQKRTICVISENAVLSRFFELELITLGYETSVLSGIAYIKESYDAIILDVDTVSGAIPCECPIISVSEHLETGIRTLPWPTPIQQIGDVLARVFDSAYINSDTKPDQENKDVVYFTGKNTVLLNGVSIVLTNNEASVLRALCNAKSDTVDREELMTLLGATEGNICDVYVCHLRKKLEGHTGRRLIFTHRGEGYSTSLVINE
jgi:DNA-binding response OmpR family regulator